MFLTVLLTATIATAQLPPEQAATVVDARTGKPLARAEVTVTGVRGTIRADDDGRFSWPASASGTVVVVVVLPEGRVTKPIVLTIDRAITMRIAVETTFAEAVKVQGAAPGIDVAGGASLAVLSADEISLRHPATLTQTLEGLPGVSPISEGQAQTPAIRGLARGRTLLLVDGVRVSTERGAGANASFLDPADLARVEVARGPGSVAYGSDAFGGVVAARTRRPAFATPMRLAFAGTLGAGVPERRAALEWSRGYRSGGVLIGVRHREFDDYTSPNGVVPQSSWRDSGGRLRWEHRQGPHAWTVGWQSDTASDIARPRSDSTAIRATSPFERSHRLTSSYEAETAGLFGTVRVDALMAMSEERLEQDRLAATGRPRRIDRTDTEARDFQARVTAERTIGSRRWQFGADVQGRFGLTATDTTFNFNLGGTPTTTVVTQSIEDARRTAAGLFAQGEVIANERVRLSGGLRGDVVSSRNRGGYFGDRSVSRGAVAGVATLTYQAGRRLAVTGQIARGFREPTLSDRFSRGPVGRGFLEGNPDLRSEHSVQLDLSLRYTTPRVVVTAAGYHYRIRNLVERYTAGVDLFRIRNRGRARLYGAEVEAQVPLGRGVAVDVSIEASRGEDADSGAPIDDIAPARVGIALRHGQGPFTSFVRAMVLRDHGRAGPSEVPTPGYFLLDAGARWRLSANMEVHLVARNLTDAAYYSSAGPRWVWAPGRQATVTFVVGFER